MKIKSLVVASIFLGLVGLPLAHAAEFFSPEKDSTGNLTLGAMEKHRNVYAAGANLTINSETIGDLFAAGQDITVDGVVEQDAVLAGESVSVNGKVGGDARLAGRSVKIVAPVGGDVLAAGATVFLSDKAMVNGDLFLAGANVEVNAPVAGSVKIAGTNLVINSKVNGDVWVKSGGTVVFGPGANVAGKVKVYAKNQPVVKEGAVVPDLDYENVKNVGRYGERKDIAKGFAGFFAGTFIVKLLAYLIALLILMNVAPKRLGLLTERIPQALASNVGIGFAGLVLTPIAIVLLFFTLVGYYVAFILLFWYILALAISCLVSMAFLGQWIIKMANKKTDAPLDWKTALVGVIGFMIVSLVPIVGWVAILLLVLASFGSIIRHAKTAIDA